MNVAAAELASLFSHQDFAAAPMDGGLLQRIAPAAIMSVEITFDTAQPDMPDALYVNLCNASRSTLSHVSIRPASGRVVLNVRKDAVWGEEVVANVEFAALRYWRLWLTVDGSGTMSVQLGPVTLCTRPTELLPEAVVIIESNVSVCSAFPALSHESDLCAIGHFTSDTRASLLVHMPNHDPETLRTVRGAFEEMRPLPEMGADWWHGFAEFDSQSEAAFTDGRTIWRLRDMIGEAVVEVGASALTLRTPQAAAICWASNRDARVVMAPHSATQTDPRGLSFYRYVASFEDCAAAADRDGLPTLLTLTIAGQPSGFAVDPKAMGSAFSGVAIHPCAMRAGAAMAALRETDLPPQATNNAPFSPGFFFSWDTAENGVEIRLSSKEHLLQADITAPGALPSLCLNIELGRGTFAGGDTLGLVADIGATSADGSPAKTLPHLRSVGHGMQQKTEFTEALAWKDKPEVAIALHRVTKKDPASWRKEAHFLVLPLPPHTRTLTLNDLRLFVLKA